MSLPWQRVREVFRKRVAFIDPEKCRRCVACVGSCPLGALKGSPGSVPVVSHSLCTGCGLCVEACRFNAIEVRYKWGIYPIAVMLVVLTLVFVGVAAIHHALTSASQPPAPPTPAPQPGASGFNVSWGEVGGAQVNYSYYETLENEAGTSGG